MIVSPLIVSPDPPPPQMGVLISGPATTDFSVLKNSVTMAAGPRNGFVQNRPDQISSSSGLFFNRDHDMYALLQLRQG